MATKNTCRCNVSTQPPRTWYVQVTTTMMTSTCVVGQSIGRSRTVQSSVVCVRAGGWRLARRSAERSLLNDCRMYRCVTCYPPLWRHTSPSLMQAQKQSRGKWGARPPTGPLSPPTRPALQCGQ